MEDEESAMDQSFGVVAVRIPFSAGIVVDSITREAHIVVVRDVAAVGAMELDLEEWALALGHGWVAGEIHALGVEDAHE